jgi:hypothetical protein
LKSAERKLRARTINTVDIAPVIAASRQQNLRVGDNALLNIGRRHRIWCALKNSGCFLAITVRFRGVGWRRKVARRPVLRWWKLRSLLTLFTQIGRFG